MAPTPNTPYIDSLLQSLLFIEIQVSLSISLLSILKRDIAWSVWWLTKVGYLEGGWVEECAYIVTYYLNDHFEVVSQAAFSFMTILSFIQWFTSIYVYLFIETLWSCGSWNQNGCNKNTFLGDLVTKFDEPQCVKFISNKIITVKPRL